MANYMILDIITIMGYNHMLAIIILDNLNYMGYNSKSYDMGYNMGYNWKYWNIIGILEIIWKIIGI